MPKLTRKQVLGPSRSLPTDRPQTQPAQRQRACPWEWLDETTTAPFRQAPAPKELSRSETIAKEKATEYADANDIDYIVIEPKQKKFIIKSYADNFTKN